MFTNSAHLYDAIYSWLDYPSCSQRLDALIKERNPKATTLLGVACGTGGHLQYLSRRYRAEGVDLDEAMLEIARNKLPDISFHQGDMRDFSLGRRFDAVTCLFSSIGYMGGVEDLNRAVMNMASHLEPGGVLAIEPWFRPAIWNDGHIHADHVDRPDLKVARFSKSGRRDRLALIEFHYLVLTVEGFDSFTENHELFLFTHEEYLTAFEAAGLRTDYDARGLMSRGLYLGIAPKVESSGTKEV